MVHTLPRICALPLICARFQLAFACATVPVLLCTAVALTTRNDGLVLLCAMCFVIKAVCSIPYQVQEQEGLKGQEQGSIKIKECKQS